MAERIPCAVEPGCTRTPSRVWQGERMCTRHYNIVRCGWTKCSLECGRWAELRGLCSACYVYRDLRGMEPKRAQNVCSVDGCTERLMGSMWAGMCAYHGYRMKRYGDPLYRRPPRQETCSVEGCKKSRSGTNPLCSAHTSRRARHGDVNGGRPTYTTLIDALVSRVNFEGAEHPQLGRCWEWTGGTNVVGGGGYGIFCWRTNWRTAHRCAWELMVGPIPDGLVLDHLCRNTICVRPEHLEPVANRENLRRGWVAAEPDIDIKAAAGQGFGKRRDKGCPADGCGRATGRSEFCPAHNARLTKYGNVLAGSPLPPINRAKHLARFWGFVDKREEGCWVWTDHLSNGYGHFAMAGFTHMAHRLAYEELVGPIPPGLVLDHLCQVKRCVNPAHLEPVTCRENIRRGYTAGRSTAT